MTGCCFQIPPSPSLLVGVVIAFLSFSFITSGPLKLTAVLPCILTRSATRTKPSPLKPKGSSFFLQFPRWLRSLSTQPIQFAPRLLVSSVLSFLAASGFLTPSTLNQSLLNKFPSSFRIFSFYSFFVFFIGIILGFSPISKPIHNFVTLSSDSSIRVLKSLMMLLLRNLMACKRVGQLGSNLGMGWIDLAPPRVYSSPYRAPSALLPLTTPIYWRHFSQLANSNGKRLFLVDTLALVRRLEGQGVPSKQAEAITAAITDVLNDTMENASQSFVSKGEIQKIEMIQEANVSKFKSEVQSSQGHHFSMLQHETEKLRNDIEKMRSELRYEIDKVTAGQRLDLNLERGRIRDELNNQSAETTNLTNKLDREIHALKAQLEAAKYEVIKYCIGTLVSISAVGLAVVRILM